MQSKATAIQTDRAPKAEGLYSQGVRLKTGGEWLFVSGQIPLDPETGKVFKGAIQTLTKKVLDNIEAILHEGGASLSDVVRVEIFLTDINDYAAVNEEYTKRFVGEPLPTRQAVQVSALPLGAPLEISCIAITC